MPILIDSRTAPADSPSHAGLVPETMRAAVYRGEGRVVVERVPTPVIGQGELLVRVEACGVCHTDLKKIEHDLLPPPRIYGHETAGVVAAVGPDVAADWRVGDRVAVFHHIPCKACFYCSRRDYAQCEGYKKVGVTAGFEPAGGGFAEYVRVMDWIVERGVERIPDSASFERATFVEPLNTCLKGLEKAGVEAGDTVVVMGQGPIGLLFTHLLTRRSDVGVFATDPLANRREKALRLGAAEAWDPTAADVRGELRACTAGRGADVAIVAAAAPGIVEEAARLTRPGARILLFAQTSPQESFVLDGAQVGKDERMVFGSYSASVDLQRESAEIVWSEDFPAEELISHEASLDEFERAVELARRPRDGSLKVVVSPRREGKA